MAVKGFESQFDKAQVGRTKDPYEYKGLGKRRVLEIIRQRLDLERSSFIPHWRELAEFICPRRPKFFITDVNRGDRRTMKILDATATLAARTLTAGMMSGTCNPTRPWFEMGSVNPDVGKFGNSKIWLSGLTEAMKQVLLLSNFYNVAPLVIDDLCTFGTGALWMEEDFDTVCRFYSLPIGSYMIGTDYRGHVCTIVREFRMTVWHVVEKFGLDKTTGQIDWSQISSHVQSLYNRHLYDEWVDIIHCVRPNPEWDPRKLQSRYKRFDSTYYEKGISGTTSSNYFTDDPTKFLEEKGYDFFPALVPRWQTCGEDYYGTICPGMISLADVKQLQTGEKRSLQAIEKMVNPPMKGPSSLANKRPSILPGDMTFLDEREGQKGFTPVHEVKFDISQLEEKQAQVRKRIEEAFFKSIMLMISQSEDPQKTATEINARQEEKFLVLGPVLDQLNQDLFNPLFQNLFTYMLRQRMVPPPPPELHGQMIRPVYVSIMAQAQKLAGIGNIERFTQFITATNEAVPDAHLEDNIDWDKLTEVYGDRTSVDVGIVKDPAEVQKTRDARQKAAAQAQQAQAANQAANAAKNLSQTSMGGDSALTRVLNSNQGGTTEALQ